MQNDQKGLECIAIFTSNYILTVPRLQDSTTAHSGAAAPPHPNPTYTHKAL